MEDPKTPDKFQICSTRSWTGQVRCWRRKLHEWDPPSGEKDDIFALVSKRYVTKIQHLIWILKHLEYCSKLPWLETQAPSWSRVKIANVGSKEYKMWTYITTSHYFSPLFFSNFYSSNVQEDVISDMRSSASSSQNEDFSTDLYGCLLREKLCL